MQQALHFRHVTAHEQGCFGSDAINGPVNINLLLLTRPVQYKIGHALIQLQGARMPNTDAQTPEVRRSERRLNIFETIMSTAAATTKKAKRRVKKNIPTGVAHIQATFNNTVVTITDLAGPGVRRFYRIRATPAP